MALWKKLIYSGSRAELLDVSASFFKGNGSAITGVISSSFATSASWAPAAVSSPVIQSFSQWASDQDNLSINSTTTIMRISGDSGIRALTSISASGMTNGREIKLINTGSHPVIIQSQHPDATSGNSFGISQDAIILPNGMCSIVRDGTSNVFRLINNSQSPQHMVGRMIVPGSSTAADWGDIAFNLDFGSVYTITATSTLPAAFVANTSANSNGDAYVSAVKTTNGLFAFGSVYGYYKALISIPTIANGTNDYYAQCGFFSTTVPTSTLTDSVVILYNYQVNSGRWTGRSASGGATSSIDLGVALSTNTLYTLEIYLNKQLNEARFFINGVYRGRVTSNLPTSGVVAHPQAGISKLTGTTGREIYVHQIDFWGLYSY